METEMTVEEYNKTIKKLVKLMNIPSFSEERKRELEKVLDKIDSYNGMDFLKFKSNWLIKNSDLDLIANYLIKNQIFDIHPELTKFLVNQHLSNADEDKACKILLKNSKPFVNDKNNQTTKLNSDAPNNVSAILTGPSHIPRTKPSCISPKPIPWRLVIK